ncbi:hypothetical protein PHLH4_29800 [Pseudomonas sp. St316]|nr:hypothetical protein PHLH4_29800 [Pseudomonas sp. St316]
MLPPCTGSDIVRWAAPRDLSHERTKIFVSVHGAQSRCTNLVFAYNRLTYRATAHVITLLRTIGLL